MYALLTVLMVFCAVVGYGIASNDYSVWTAMVFVIAAAVTLQLSYLATALMHHV